MTQQRLNMAVWLEFDVVDRHHVASSQCSICTKFSTQLEPMRIFRCSFIVNLMGQADVTFQQSLTTQLQICTVVQCYYTRSNNLNPWLRLWLLSSCNVASSSFNETSNEHSHRKFDIAYIDSKSRSLPSIGWLPYVSFKNAMAFFWEPGIKMVRSVLLLHSILLKSSRSVWKWPWSQNQNFILHTDWSTDATNINMEMFLMLCFNTFQKWWYGSLSSVLGILKLVQVKFCLSASKEQYHTGKLTIGKKAGWIWLWWS